MSPAALGPGGVAGDGRFAHAELVAAGVLDADDIGADVGEHARAEGEGFVGEVENAGVVEHWVRILAALEGSIRLREGDSGGGGRICW